MEIGFKLNDQGFPEFFTVENETVFMVQQCWPDGSKWDSADQATLWAEAYVEQVNNPASEFVAGGVYPDVLVGREQDEARRKAIVDAEVEFLERQQVEAAQLAVLQEASEEQVDAGN